MTRDLRAEVSAFLAVHGPATAPMIGIGIRAARGAVDAVLAQDGFSRSQRPEGAHPNSVYWVSSGLVSRSERLTQRAARLLEVLADGEWHSRAEILGRANDLRLTNNAASELRRHVRPERTVVFERGGYRLVSLAAPEAPRSSSPSGAASEPSADRVAA